MKSALSTILLLAICTPLLAQPATRPALPPATRPVTWEAGQSAMLHADEGEKAIRLLWKLRKWPEGATAFEVRRRAVGADAAGREWQKVTPRPVEPGMIEGKDLSNVESDPAELARLQAELAKQLSAPRAQKLTKAQWLDRMRAASEDDLRNLAGSAMSNFDFALLFGFACIDRKASEKDHFEYGLFPIQADGTAAAQPLATYEIAHFTANDPRLALRNVSVTIPPGPNGLDIRWELEESKAQKWTIYACHLYRAEQEGGPWQRISRTIGTPTSDGIRRWSHTDRTADPARSYIYAVAAMTVFDRELPTRTVVRYEPPANAPRPRLAPQE